MQDAFLSTLRVLVHLITVILKGILFLFKGNEIETQRSQVIYFTLSKLQYFFTF